MKFFTKSITAILLTIPFLMSGCGENINIKIPGVNGPRVDLQEDHIVVSLIHENFESGGGLRVPVPSLKDSYIEVGPDINSAGTLFKVSLALEDLANEDWDQVNPQSLPGGRAIPGTSSGKLPALAFSIPDFHNITLYVGNLVYGIFVPVEYLRDHPTNMIETFRFYIQNKRAGTISIVGPDEEGNHAGVLLLLDLNQNRRLKRRFLRMMRKRGIYL